MNQHAARRWQFGDVIVLRHVETSMSARMIHAVLGDPASTEGNQPFLVGGKVVTVQARPYRVIRHTEDVIALFQPEDTLLPRWLIAERRYLPSPQRSRGESVRLLFPNKAYDVTSFFDARGEPPWFFDALFNGDGLRDGWRQSRSNWSSLEDGQARGRPGLFRGWYVNLQSPPLPRSYGFDIVDHTLDIVIRPDLSWYRKDTDELNLAVAKGACSQAEAAAIRSVGEEVIKLIESHAPPFDGTWTRWHADANPNWPAIESFPTGWQEEPALLGD